MWTPTAPVMARQAPEVLLRRELLPAAVEDAAHNVGRLAAPEDTKLLQEVDELGAVERARAIRIEDREELGGLDGAHAQSARQHAEHRVPLSAREHRIGTLV